MSAGILHYNAGLFVSQDFVIQNAAIDSRYLRVAKTRANKNESQAWKFEIINGICYFCYQNLPLRVAEQLPEYRVLSQNAVRHETDHEKIVSNSMLNGYKSFMSLYKKYHSEKSKQLSQAASVVHEAKLYIERQSVSFSKSLFFKELAHEIKISDIKYLPRAWRTLRDKIESYNTGTEITDLVHPKNEGNQNASKFANNEVIKDCVVELGASQKNYSCASVFRKTRLMCEQTGISYPSQRWVHYYMSKPETKYLIHTKYGTGSRFNHKYRAYTPLKTALYAGDCWQIDGTRINLVDHLDTVTKDGVRKTTKRFLYIVAVRDVMSGLPIGWEYCHEESAQTVLNALAMAVKNTGYIPYELIYDRFPGHNTEEWAKVEETLRDMGTIMTKTHKAEGKANIERWFGTLQSVFMTESDLYYGEGVKSTRPSAHRSKEYVAEMRTWATRNGFTFDAAANESDSIINAYINTPYSRYSRKFASIEKSPAQLHQESDKPNTTSVKENDIQYLFGLKKQVSIRNHMIQTQIDGVVHYYGIDECELVEKYTGIKLTNCFDCEDLSKVYLYDGKEYLGVYNELNQAQRFGPNKELSAVGKTKKTELANQENRAKKIAEIRNAIPVNEQFDEVSESLIFLGGSVAKPICEAAETAYLQQQWGEQDEQEIEINTRSKY